MKAAREGAARSGYGAMQDMAAALRSALGGTRLHGMPNLGSGSRPFPAARIRGPDDGPLPVPRAGDASGRQVMVLTHYGELAWASRDAAGGVELAPVMMADVQAEDVKLMADVVDRAIARHCYTLGERTGEFLKLRDLAQRITEAIACK